MVQGRLTEADTQTIQLGATPSGLTSAHLHHPPYFYRPDALPAAQPTASKHWRQQANHYKQLIFDRVIQKLKMWPLFWDTVYITSSDDTHTHKHMHNHRRIINYDVLHRWLERVARHSSYRMVNKTPTVAKGHSKVNEMSHIFHATLHFFAQ